MKRETVELDDRQRAPLESMISGGKESARSQLHARLLWKADQGSQGSAWNDERIADALEVGRSTGERVRQRCVQGGLLDAVVRRPQPERPEKRKRDGTVEAHLVTRACSQTEGGRARWTMRLRAEKLVHLGSVDQISHHTVWVTGKKRNANHGERSTLASHQRRMLHACIGWTMSWRCLIVPLILGVRTSVWTREARRCSLTSACQSRWASVSQSGSMTNMNGRACAACFLRWNRKQECAGCRSRSDERKKIGLSSCVS